ncbi:MAG: hypothetical protein GEU97_13955 [Actinophytocola sp.]|nr:hypothetical protein [Actinophytocola sp.]
MSCSRVRAWLSALVSLDMAPTLSTSRPDVTITTAPNVDGRGRRCEIQPVSDFDVATTVRARPDGGFDVELDGRWSAGGVPHGGYLLGVLGKAAAVVSGEHPHLTSVSASFLRTPEAGPARVDVEVLRVGRSTTQLRAALRQGDALVLDTLLTQGVLDDADPWWSSVSPVELPDEADCVRIPVEAPGAGFRVELMEFVDQRLDPGVLGFARGKPSGKGRIVGQSTQLGAVRLPE